MEKNGSGSDDEHGAGSSVSVRTPVSHVVLAAAAAVAAWFPVESRPWSAPLIAAAVLAMIPWGWDRSRRSTRFGLLAAVSSVMLLGLSGLTGWDPSRAVGEIAIVAAVAAVAWLASRSRPPEHLVLLLAVGLAGLSIWGLAQAAFGLEGLRADLDSLSTPARAYVGERLASRRAFASLPLPSHLAVLLATTLPLLLCRVRATPAGAVWAGWSALVVAGLVATRSPAGVALAMLAGAAVVVRRRRGTAVVGVSILAAALVAVVLVRPDMKRLEPVELRLDNWRTAGWLWSTSPWSGVGVASFAQASQALPLEVRNRPAHAHNLPLEALAELGPVGLTGVALLGVALFLMVRRRWNERPALAAAVLVVPLHNLVDFSFFVSGVAVPWAVLLGWLLADRADSLTVAGRTGSLGRAMAVLGAAAALATTVLHTTSIVVEQAAAGAPSVDQRMDGAVRALELAPWRVEPQFLLATTAIDSGDPELIDRARSELERLRWLRPRSAALAKRRARLALADGDVSSALAELWTALTYGSSDSGAASVFAELVEVEGSDRVPSE